MQAASSALCIVRGLLPVRQHSHKSSPFYGRFKHFLVLEADARVVALPDVPEVIDERFYRRIILVIDVWHCLEAEGALLGARIGPLLFGLLSHVERRIKVPARRLR